MCVKGDRVCKWMRDRTGPVCREDKEDGMTGHF